MKRFAVLVLAYLLFSLLPARAQSPDEQYVQIYSLIQEGDSLNRAGESARSLAKYIEAQSALQRFQKGYPDWNPQVIKFRQSYLDEKIRGESGHTPAVASPPRPAVAVPQPKLPPGNLTAPAQPPKASTSVEA